MSKLPESEITKIKQDLKRQYVRGDSSHKAFYTGIVDVVVDAIKMYNDKQKD